MTIRHLGYACQNVSIPATTGRTLRLASLSPGRLREVISQNLESLMRILRWNTDRGIHFFRISSDMIPFASHPEFCLDWRKAFASELEVVRRFVHENGVRLTMHPGQFTVLNSPRPDVVENAIAELEYHAALLEEVDPAAGTYTLHVGGAYGDKRAAVERFVTNFARLSGRARSRLVLENDDTTYSAIEVLQICEELHVPLVYDYLHHKCLPSGIDEDELPDLLASVVDTWSGRIPKFHLSSLKEGTRSSHADFIRYEDYTDFLRLVERVKGGAYDVMLEAKRKDEALLRLFELA